MITPERYADGLHAVRTAAAAADRGDGAVSGAVYLWVTADADARWARRTGIEAVSRIYGQDFTDLADRYLLLGNPAQVVDRLGEFAAAGAATAMLQVAGPPAARERIRATLAEQVLGAV
jgi:alkanesulfonate monooxygenase SsuD/methylene tetrahydromethanopterin reductase-like flavin-dependent oxidoreductase (luciferase family)